MTERVIPTWLQRSFRVRPAVQRAGAADEVRAVDRPSLPAELSAESGLLEACRSLRANLSPGQPGETPPPLFLLGSASDRPGALVAAGLALVLAAEGKRTLLVDADLRQPAIHSLFGLPPAPGLANALEAPEAPLPTTVVDEHLSVLTAGTSAHNAAALLSGPTLGSRVREAASAFEAVIYRAGQLAYADPLLLAAHVRTAVLLVRAGIDTAEQTARVKHALERAGVSILGFALLDQGG